MARLSAFTFFRFWLRRCSPVGKGFSLMLQTHVLRRALPQADLKVRHAIQVTEVLRLVGW